jgi:quinol monooxygenase YgiN
MADQETRAGIVFVNGFTLHCSHEEFERAFAETATFLEKQPGLIGYTLSRSIDRPDHYVNIAYWRDAESLRAAAAQPAFQAHAEALRTLSSREHTFFAPRLTYSVNS